MDTSAGSRIKKAFKGACKRVGIADFTPHGCRHTWASWHYIANRDLKKLQQLGGWKTLSMVLRYVHTNVDEHKDSIDALPGETGGILGDKKNSGGKNRMTINSLGASVRSLHTGGVTGSIPVAPTIKMLNGQFVIRRYTFSRGATNFTHPPLA